MKKLKSILLLTFSLFSMGSMATTYYVAKTGNDTYNGLTPDSAFLTIGKGLQTMAAGDILLIRSGTYDEYFRADSTVFVKSGINASLPTVIKGFPGDSRPIMKPSGGKLAFLFGSRNSADVLFPDSFIVLDSLVLDLELTTPSYAIRIFFGSHHINVQNCEVLNTNNSGIQAVNGTHHLKFLNLDVHDNGSSYSDHGFYITGEHMLVEHCRVYNNFGIGIKLGTDIDPWETNDNLVRKNICYGNGMDGILLNHVAHDNIVYNNLCYRNVGAGIRIPYSAENVEIYNNTCFLNGTGILLGELDIDISNITIRNNILYKNRCTNLWIDAALQSNNIQANTNLIGIDPMFVDPKNNDFRLLTGSPAINTGANLADVPDDFAGTARPASPAAYDIGAYEGDGISGSVSHAYYVSTSGDDDNPGTLALPFRTVNKGLRELIAEDTLYVMNGFYNEIIGRNASAGISWDKPLVVKAYPGHQPQVRKIEFFYDGCNRTQQYIVVDGFKINTDTAFKRAVTISDTAHHIRIQNCEFYADSTIADLIGVLISSSAGKYNEIINCSIHHFKQEGVRIYGDSNTVKSCDISFCNSGVYIEAGSVNTIEKCLVHHNIGYNTDDGLFARGQGHIMKNNICWKNGNGIRLDSAVNVNIWNNTICKNRNGISNYAPGLSLKNNIIQFNTDSNVVYTITGTASNNLMYSNSADPEFVDVTNDNFRITYRSPALDAGTTLAAVTEDINDLLRPKREAYDMGAFEDTLAKHGFYASNLTGNDANPGTLASPFLTIARGLTELQPGDTLYVMNGTYDEFVGQNMVSGNSWTRPVVIKAYDVHTPELRRGNGSGPLAFYYDNGAAAHHHIILEGFKIYADAASDKTVAISSGAHHIRMKNCEIYSDSTATSVRGIHVSSSAGKYNEIIGCNIHHFTSAGIWMFGDSNTIRSCDISFSDMGIYVEEGSANTIEKCLIHHNDGYGFNAGIRMRDEYHTIKNNILWKNGVGIYFSLANDINVWNNTICKNDYGIVNDVTGLSLKNNIIQFNPDSNVLYAVNGTASNNLMYSNSADPEFVDVTNDDFHLTYRSPALDAGTTLTLVSEDINDVTRPNREAHDMGAYEDTLAKHGFYVSDLTGNDANTGTLTNPFLTIARGLTELQPGDTLYVMNGTYDEFVGQNMVSGNSWNKPVVIKAYDVHTPELRRGNGSGPLAFYYDNGAAAHHHIILEGFKIYADAASDKTVAISSGAHHIRMKNCEIYSDSTATSVRGIHVSSSAGKYNEIIGCNIHHFTSAGIWMFGDSNTIRSCDISFSNMGIYMEEGSANTIEKCLIHHNEGYSFNAGIRMRDEYHTIKNSILWKNGVGIYFSLANDINVWNNTICKNDYGIVNDVTGLSLKNNIIQFNPDSNVLYAVNGTASNNLMYSNSADPEFVDLTNDDFHLTSGSPAIDAGTTLADVTHDIECTERESGLYDIGAYEYMSMLAKQEPGQVGVQRKLDLVTGDMHISVYPNPSNGDVFLALAKTADAFSIRLIDMKGREIQIPYPITCAQANGCILKLSKHLFPSAGIYILRTSHPGMLQHKIVILD